ncbi:AAA family ATPase [Escherichia coli]
MRITQVKINNFRLLAEVELILENQTTVIVGRNNSGKTSLSEIMRRFLADGSATFQIEDFSSACYDRFCEALSALNQGEEENVIRELVPAIELRVKFQYDLRQPQFGPLSPFVIDLDPECTEALAVIRYELKDGQLAPFLENLPKDPLTPRPVLYSSGLCGSASPEISASKYGLKILTIQTTAESCNLTHYEAWSKQDLSTHSEDSMM